MDKDQIKYLERHKESRLKVGDSVKIRRKAKGNENGWDNGWAPEMDKYIGMIGIITRDSKGRGFEIDLGDSEHYDFPYFILENIVMPSMAQPKLVRQFESGATRDQDQDKIDYEGFLSPEVLRRYGEYMHQHRIQSDGTLRTSDNWQKGIPKEQYLKSMIRHVIDVWLENRGGQSRDGLQDALCGVMFNVMGYLFEDLKGDKREE